jgi:NADH:ubiquinone oxidoreductase subunit C
MDKLDSIVEALRGELGGGLEAVDRPHGDAVATVAKARVHDALSGLRERGFDLLLDIAGVDGLHLGRRERFEIVYILYSLRDDLRLRVKAFVPENDMNLPTATDLWQAANWAEREAYDMFGFNFVGHPNLSRILCHREFVGHALRKDYPVLKGQWATGTSDLRVDIERE